MLEFCKDTNNGLIQNYAVEIIALDAFFSYAHVEVPTMGVPFFDDACFLKVNFSLSSL